MNYIQQLLTSTDLVSIILYVFLFCFAVKGALEMVEYFYGKAKDFFHSKNNKENEIKNFEDILEKIEDDIEMIKLSVKTYGKDIDELKESVQQDEQHMLNDIRNCFKIKHHKYMELGAIDDLTLDELEKKFAFYTSRGGNGYVKTLFDDIRELKVVDAVELERLKQEKRKEESGD